MCFYFSPLVPSENIKLTTNLSMGKMSSTFHQSIFYACLSGQDNVCSYIVGPIPSLFRYYSKLFLRTSKTLKIYPVVKISSTRACITTVEGVFGIQEVEQYSKHCLQKEEDILESPMPSEMRSRLKVHVQSIKRFIKHDLN